MGKATLHEASGGSVEQEVKDNLTGATVARRSDSVRGTPGPAEPAGRVNVVLGTSLNIGDYSSWKVSVSVTVPYDANTPEEREAAFLAAYDFSRRKVEEITQAGVARAGLGVQLPKYT